jgi:hypothetical protein
VSIVRLICECPRNLLNNFWVNAVAFLAYDRNGNGQIDNGTELFGNYTVPGMNNGFAALERLASEVAGYRTGRFRQGHPLFDKLLLWTDSNHDGISQPEELEPLGLG